MKMFTDFLLYAEHHSSCKGIAMDKTDTSYYHNEVDI